MFHTRCKSLGYLIICFLFSPIFLNAQTGSSSNPLSGRDNNPYSKYGIGELANPNSTELKGMGSISSTFANAVELNPDNPASYSFLKRTTIEGGIMAGSRSITSNDLSYKTSTLSISYLYIGMPVGKNGGLSFGLSPQAHSYYSMVDTIFNSPTGTNERVYNGDGSLNYAYFGYAMKVKNLSIGFNFGYLFGNYQKNTVLVPIDSLSINRSYYSNFDNYIKIGGIYWKAGIMYDHKLIDSNYTFRIGGTFTMSQKLKERLSPFQVSTYYFGDTIVNDTMYALRDAQGNLKDTAGILTMPMSFSVGLMLAKTDVWDLGIDYSTTLWNGFSSTPVANINTGIGSKSERYSIGGEFSPVPTKVHKHFSKFTYRAGAYYGTDYLKINNTTLPNYGFTLGCSLHFKATHFSWVNLHSALDIGRLGTTQSSLVQQNYVRLSLGISFNDRWFIPRRYD